MAYNYSKLKGRIKEKYDTQASFSKALGISHVALNQKLSNHSQWRQQEINKAALLLDIEDIELAAYFFAKKV